MTLDEILKSLFPDGHNVTVDGDGLASGSGRIAGVGEVAAIGVVNGATLGVDGAVKLAAQILALLEPGGKGPLVVLVDSSSQRMSRRDEMLGLNEYLAHLSKCLKLADMQGVATVGLLYGHTAAGAFIATALSTRALVALPGAHPEVMDLPSMARVTKLSLDTLKEKAKSTAIFAPGLDNLAKTGVVDEIWDPQRSLAEQFKELLARTFASHSSQDDRDMRGKARGGRPKAADIALRVEALAADAVAHDA